MIRSRSRFQTASAIALLALSGLAAGSLAGPLNPPAGLVTSTGKTLTEVEPRIAINATNTPGDNDSVFKITQPGSYYLVGNLVVPNNMHGIEIAANSVTVDLNGFLIDGDGSSLDGVSTVGIDRDRVTVRNGTIRDTEHAVNLYGTVLQDGRGQLVENISAQFCDFGVSIDSGIIRNVTASHSVNGGIFGNNGVLVQSCVARDNQGSGIVVNTGTIRDSIAKDNALDGIRMPTRGLIDSCTSEGNLWGFGGLNFQLINSVAQDNSAGGVYTTGGAVIRNNRIYSNELDAGSLGISASNSGSHIEGNTIVRQSTAVRLTGVNNLAVSNSISACPTAFNTWAGNRVGAIVVGTSSPAINGNSGGGLGTTDPTANVLY